MIQQLKSTNLDDAKKEAEEMLKREKAQKHSNVKSLQKEVDEIKSDIGDIKSLIIDMSKAQYVNKTVPDKVEPIQETPSEPVKPKVTQAEKDSKAIEDAPEGLRKIIAEELSAKLGGIFKVGVRQRINDSYNYDVDIFIPEELAEIKGKRDCRSITISRAEGDAGVRRHCIKIRKHIANRLMNKGQLVDENLRNEVIAMKAKAFSMNK